MPFIWIIWWSQNQHYFNQFRERNGMIIMIMIVRDFFFGVPIDLWWLHLDNNILRLSAITTCLYIAFEEIKFRRLSVRQITSHRHTHHSFTNKLSDAPSLLSLAQSIIWWLSIALPFSVLLLEFRKFGQVSESIFPHLSVFLPHSSLFLSYYFFNKMFIKWTLNWTNWPNFTVLFSCYISLFPYHHHFIHLSFFQLIWKVQAERRLDVPSLSASSWWCGYSTKENRANYLVHRQGCIDNITEREKEASSLGMKRMIESW